MNRTLSMSAKKDYDSSISLDHPIRPNARWTEVTEQQIITTMRFKLTPSLSHSEILQAAWCSVHTMHLFVPSVTVDHEQVVQAFSLGCPQVARTIKKSWWIERVGTGTHRQKDSKMKVRTSTPFEQPFPKPNTLRMSKITRAGQFLK